MSVALNIKEVRLFHWLHQPLIWLVAVCGLITLFAGYLPDGHFFENPSSYLPLHTALEFFAIAVGTLIFAVVWHTRDKHQDGRSLFVAILFLGVAFLDFFHTLSFFGMPTFVTANGPSKAITFWFAARLMAITGLLGIVLFSFDVLRKTVWQRLLLLLITAIVAVVTWAQLYFPDVLPVFFIPGKGLTDIKVYIEYLLVFLTFIAAVLMYRKSERATHSYWVYLGSAALIMMFSEFYFTWYAKVTDLYNLLGHVFKITAYGLIYQAMFVRSVREPYVQLQQLQKEQAAISERLLEAQRIAHLGQWELEIASGKLSWSRGIFDLFEIDSGEYKPGYEIFLEMCHPNDRQKMQDNYTASVQAHAPYEYVYRLLMKDGRIKWVRETGYTLYDAQDKPLMRRGVVLEVTSIMEMEQSLRESEMHYRAITESLPVPLAINDQLGDVKFLSKSFVQTFGYTHNEIPNVAQWWPLAYPNAAYREQVIKKWEAGFAQLHQGNPFPELEVNIVCKNGVQRTALVSAVPLGESQHLVYLFDISARKQAEIEAGNLRDQLAQSSKMEAIGHLTAGVAHDFNNMLGAVMGYAELSQHAIETGKTEPVSRYLQEVLNASNRAKELIAQMLTFSRLAPEVMGENCPTILLSPVVKEVVSLLRSSIPSSMELSYDVVNDSLKACIQPVHLHQIMLNLCINARDAIGEYGRINISLGVMHGEKMLCSSCNGSFAGDYAVITVADSGSGIPLHIRDKIFTPFFTTKEVGKGTGMGLSVVHGLVHALGGHIHLASSGNGTTISILLPLQQSAGNDEHHTDERPVASISGVRVMVVDDELAMASMLHEFLEVYGAHIVSYTDPLQALQYFMQQPESIDLVITDETMPVMSGMHLAEQMLKRKPGQPIILCTGHSEHATPESATAMGISGFFYKPLRMNELLLTIQKVFASLHR